MSEIRDITLAPSGEKKNFIISRFQQELSCSFQTGVPSAVEICFLPGIGKDKSGFGIKRNSYLEKNAFFFPFPSGLIKAAG